MTLESLYLPDLLDGVTLEAGARGLRAIRFGARQLREYMAGERSEFDIPLDPVGTPFQLEVWKALAEIPYGSTRSYHYIAIAVNRPKGFHPWAATVADSRANKRFCNWRDNMLSDSEKQQLEQHGYLLLPGFMSPEEVAAFNARVEELFAEEGDGAGSEFKSEPGARRIANAVNKGEIFEKVIETPKVLECMEAVLGPDFKLSSLNIRSANPYNGTAQPLHVDSGALPDEHGDSVCNSVWMLDDFTEQNGALRIVPGSHRWGRAPEPGAKPDGEMLVTGKAGDVVIMNSHLWHGGSENKTARQRRAMHVYYTRGDKPQQQYQKRQVRPEVQARLSPSGRKLLALDDPRNDALSAEGSGASGFMK